MNHNLMNLDVKQEPKQLKYVEPKRLSECEYKDGKYCKASDTQKPVIPCKYADYTVDSFYPTCSKGERT